MQHHYVSQFFLIFSFTVKTRPGSFQWCPVTGQEATGRVQNTGGSPWILGALCALCVPEHWHRYPGAVCGVSCGDLQKPPRHGLGTWSGLPFCSRGWAPWAQRGPSNPTTLSLPSLLPPVLLSCFPQSDGCRLSFFFPFQHVSIITKLKPEQLYWGIHKPENIQLNVACTNKSTEGKHEVSPGLY